MQHKGIGTTSNNPHSKKFYIFSYSRRKYHLGAISCYTYTLGAYMKPNKNTLLSHVQQLTS